MIMGKRMFQDPQLPDHIPVFLLLWASGRIRRRLVFVSGSAVDVVVRQEARRSQQPRDRQRQQRLRPEIY
jgi:hypothetical protein